MRLAPSLALLGLFATSWATFAGPVAASDATFRTRPPEDEIVYFMLPDRFENGDPANTATQPRNS